METSSIDDIESWLESEEPQVAICIATRNALRVLPYLGEASDASLNTHTLNVLRATLIAAACSRFPTANLARECRSAARAIHGSEDAIAFVYEGYDGSMAHSSVRSAESAVGAATVFLAGPGKLPENVADGPVSKLARYSIGVPGGSSLVSATIHDANWIKDGREVNDVFDQPLWPAQQLPQEFHVGFKKLRAFFHDDPSVWSYWNRWVDGYLKGLPVNWDVQLAIATLSDSDWQKGPNWVARKIAEIEAGILGGKLPLAEIVEHNSKTDKLAAVPQQIAKPDLLGATLSQVEDALEDVIATCSNGIHERSREYVVLQRTIAKYGNDPQRIEMDLTSVYGGILRQLANDELPASEENIALQTALQEGAQGIRATHPEVAKNRELLTSQALAELSDDDKATLREAQPVLEEISEGQLRNDWSDDIPFLLETHHRVAPPTFGAAYRNEILAGYNEKVRIFSRAAKIMLLLKSTPNLIKKLEASATFKAGTIVSVLYTLIQIGISLI